MAHVFISYKREELSSAQLVASGLREEGFTVFYDVDEDGNRVGERWDERLRSELEIAGAVVALWSRAAVKSGIIIDECNIALKRDALFPAWIEQAAAPMGLGPVQAANLVGWKGDRADIRWRVLVRALHDKIRADVPRPSVVATPRDRAHWEKIKDEREARSFIDYLVAEPTGAFRETAFARLLALRAPYRFNGAHSAARSLREARESWGYTAADICVLANLPKGFVESVDERFGHDLPMENETYSKVRKYAEFVGLHSPVILDLFVSEMRKLGKRSVHRAEEEEQRKAKERARRLDQEQFKKDRGDIAPSTTESSGVFGCLLVSFALFVVAVIGGVALVRSFETTGGWNGIAQEIVVRAQPSIEGEAFDAILVDDPKLYDGVVRSTYWQRANASEEPPPPLRLWTLPTASRELRETSPLRPGEYQRVLIVIRQARYTRPILAQFDSYGDRTMRAIGAEGIADLEFVVGVHYRSGAASAAP